MRNTIYGQIYAADRRNFGTTQPLLWFHQRDRVDLVFDNTMEEDGSNWSYSFMNQIYFVDQENRFNSSIFPGFSNPDNVNAIKVNLKRIMVNGF